MINESMLRYRRARYLWVALALIGACLLLYSTQAAHGRPSGDTWQGYVLGTIAALMIVWLAWLGIRKRRYRATSGSLAGWTSAHVYLGAALIGVITLHCAAKFGWNVHTLAYALTCAVVLSGLFGVYAYASLPRQVARNRTEGLRSSLFAELYALDNEGRDVARRCNVSINAAVKSSIERTAIGGGVFAQLFGADRSLFIPDGAASSTRRGLISRNRDQQAVLDYVSHRVPRADRRTEAADLQQLVLVLCRRQAVLRRIRRDIRLHAWLKVWLYLHVPLSIALIVALIAHILATFLYW